MPGGPERDQLLRGSCSGDVALEQQLANLLRADEANTVSDIPEISQGVVEFGADEAVPVSIGPYQVHRMVGQGGMAIVFESTHNTTGRRYAVKLIRVFISSLRSRERLKLEAESLSRLGHQGIAKFHEAGMAQIVYPSGVTARAPFIAMEFIEGVPIDRFAADNRLDFEQRIRLIIQALRGLHHAHQQGVIQRKHWCSAAALVPVSSTGVINKQSPHRYGRGSEELQAILKVQVLLPNKLEVGLVDQGGRLQSMP